MINLSTEMKKLEIDVIKGKLEKADRIDQCDLIEKSKSSRSLVDATASALHGELASHILKHNTSKRGIISWIKPGSNLKVNPEPIHLKAALKYVMVNEDYISTGFHPGDLFALDVDSQHAKIMSFLSMKAAQRQSLPSEQKQFTMSSYERLKALFFGDGVHFAHVDYSQLIAAAKPICQTALAVLQDVMDQSLKTHHTQGMKLPKCFI